MYNIIGIIIISTLINCHKDYNTKNFEKKFTENKVTLYFEDKKLIRWEEDSDLSD